MTDKQAYLEEWYSEMTSGAVQTFEQLVPETFGSGRIAQAVSGQGIIVSDLQLCTDEDVRVQGVTSGDYMWMIFCLGDGIFWEDLDSRKSITMEKQEACVYTGHGGFESIRYAQNATYDFRTVKVPRKIFTALTDDYLGGLTAARLERKVTEDVLHVSLSPQMARVLAELGDAENYPGGLGKLFLDGKLSELFAVILGAAITDDCAAFRAPTLSRTERAAIREAKHIIDAAIAYAPSCEELARQVHISAAKLSRGFSAIYGQSLHQYVIAERLETGARLLLENEKNVGEIAALVGYGKASNFAAAFKKRFGVAPREYRASHSNGRDS